jgi:hypothetical protein
MMNKREFMVRTPWSYMAEETLSGFFDFTSRQAALGVAQNDRV